MVWYNLGVAASEPDIFHRYFKVCGESFVESNHPAMQVMFNFAKKAFEECMKLSRDCEPLAHFALGNMYFDYYCYYSNRVKYVLPEYLKALKGKDIILKHLGKESLAALYTNIARVYLAMAEVSKAREYYLKAISIYPIDTAYEHLMWVELELGNYSGVLRLMKKFVNLWGEEANLALSPAAIAALHLGRYDEVIKYSKEIIEKFPESAYLGEAYRLITEVMIRKGNISEAVKYLLKDIEVCSEVLKIKNFPIPGNVPGAYYERSIAYYKLGITGNNTYISKAIKDLEWIIEYPRITNREVAHRNYYLLAHAPLACAYAKIGKFDLAKKILDKILKELESNVEFSGWRKVITKVFRKIYDDISQGKVPKIPHEIEELEH